MELFSVDSTRPGVHLSPIPVPTSPRGDTPALALPEVVGEMGGVPVPTACLVLLSRENWHDDRLPIPGAVAVQDGVHPGSTGHRGPAQ